MRSELHVHVDAPYDRIFDLAADVERWPELLPHYRYVRRLDAGDGERHFAMGARRGPIPVTWRAIQRLHRADRRIEFTHTGGVTKGMWVAWRFADDPAGGLDVSIEHRLKLRWPLVGEIAARHVIGPQFIEAIAGRTLRQMKRLAEGTDGA